MSLFLYSRIWFWYCLFLLWLPLQLNQVLSGLFEVPRLFAVILIYLLIAIAFACVVFFLLIPLLSESGDFLKNFPVYFNASVVSDTIGNTGFVADLTNSLNIEKVITQINTLVATVSGNAFGTVTTVFGGLLSFFLMTILSFYLAVEEDGVGKFLKAITPLKHEKYVVARWLRSQRKIGLWMQGQLVLAIIIGMLVYLGLSIINVPNALLLASLAAAFEIIPLFGPIAATRRSSTTSHRVLIPSRSPAPTAVRPTPP